MNAGLSTVVLLWLATYCVQSTLILGGVWFFERMQSNASPALREALWRAAFLGAIATASLQSIGIVEPVFGVMRVAVDTEAAHRAALLAASGGSSTIGEFVSSDAGAVAGDSRIDPQLGRQSGSQTGPFIEPTAGAVTGTDLQLPQQISSAADVDEGARIDWLSVDAWMSRPWDPLDWGLAVLAAWLTVALVLGAGILRMVCAARHELRDRTPIFHGPVLDRVTALARTARLRRLPRVSASSRIDGPLTLPSGEICIPAWAADKLSASQLDAMLAHEMAHWLRRDALWRVVTLVVQCALFFQPLNWLARKRLSTLAEVAADDWSAAHTGQGYALAECLAAFAAASRRRRAPVFAAAIVREPGTLVHRVQRLLEGQYQGGVVRPTVKLAIGIATMLSAGIRPGVVAQSLDAPESVRLAQDSLVCVHPDVVHGLVLRGPNDSSVVISTEMPAQMSTISPPAEFQWIASAARSSGTASAFKSSLPPRDALADALTALESDGWAPREPMMPSNSFVPSLQRAVTLCRGERPLSLSVMGGEATSYVVYTFFEDGWSTACNEVSSAVRADASMNGGAVERYMPNLRFPTDPSTGRAAITFAGASGGSERGRYSSTKARLEVPLAELASLLSQQLSEQGWTADSSWSGAVTAGSTWSRQPRPDTRLAATLEIVEIDEKTFDVLFNIMRLNQER